MRIVCLSDTHGRLAELDVPVGDVLVCAGDFTRRGTEEEIGAFARSLHALPHPDKVIVAGNHDFLFERDPDRARARLGDVRYLCDEGVTIGGRTFWGSPWQPEFHDWAFNLPRGPALARKWALVPDATDVLVTHGPPRGVLDRTVYGEEVGCDDLTAALARIAPRLHVFGHIHEAHGTLERGGTTYVNAAICDIRYRVAHAPVVVEI